MGSEGSPGLRKERAALLPLAGLAAAVLLTAGWALDEIGLSGYNPARQSISALGAVTMQRAWVWNAMVSLSGLGVVGFAVAMHRMFRRDRASRIGVGLLYVWGVGFLIDGFVRLDTADQSGLSAAIRNGSWHQRTHVIESVIDIAAMTAAPFLFAIAFRGQPTWERVGIFSLGAGATIAAGDLWYVLSGDGGISGIAERVLISAAAVWMAGVCVRLIVASVPTSEPRKLAATPSIGA